MKQRRIFCNSLILIAFVTAFVFGCAQYRDLAPGTIQKIPVRIDPAALRAGADNQSPIVEEQRISVAPLEEPAPSPEYTIGPGDVLYINISGKPEFSSLTATTTYSNLGNVKAPSGSRVDGNGNVHLPYIGAVHIGGLSITQAQNRIAEAARKFINDPWVIVEVGEYKSHPLYLLGQFRNSGTFYMDRPLNLLQGIALGNGYDASADLSSARLIRDKKTLPVDIQELLTRGNQRHNVWLKPGDTIYIPDNRSKMVFVFGAVKKAGPIPIPPEGLTLAQAVATAELRDTGHDFRYVRIIRSLSTIEGELMVVDFDKILRGEAMPMMLRQGDIVYIPKSGLGTWNDALNEILPSLHAFSAILQPFVQIKYLAD